jgi:hypothetical protein
MEQGFAAAVSFRDSGYGKKQGEGCFHSFSLLEGENYDLMDW